MYATILNQPHLIHSAAKAQELAAQLNADSDGWTYTAKVFDNGRAVVEVRDEDGYLLGNL